jgi:hypothetical protein
MLCLLLKSDVLEVRIILNVLLCCNLDPDIGITQDLKNVVL